METKNIRSPRLVLARRTVTPWAWMPTSPWTCPRRSSAIDTADAGPRCPACDFVEGS